MQGIRIRLLMGGIILAAVSCTLQAETLQPDPAWQQGKLDNGFSWQLLTTPQRPSDRIEMRLIVETGSLAESALQTGYSHLLPRLAMVHNANLDPTQQRTLWQQGIDPQRPLSPAVTSYSYTIYNLSLPNNRPDMVKDALSWLAATVGKMTIDENVVNTALNADDPIATWPANTQDVLWRYRLKGSALLGHDPATGVTTPVDLPQLNAFYKQWYTPDIMTLYVVGNVDSRSLTEQINKAFSSLKGKREQPPAMPMLAVLPQQPVNLVDPAIGKDRLSLVWDNAWQPIQQSQHLQRYWQSDLAREALFWHVQRVLSDKKTQGVKVGFDCRVIYQRSQCAINIDSDNGNLSENMDLIAKEMANVRDRGLTQQEFDALMAHKKDELNKLFATYARTSTDVLMSQRLRSQQNSVVDIAPEQYQKLRRAFLSGMTLDMLNQELRQQLTQDISMILMQPPGEPEINAGHLQESWQKIMQPADASAPSQAVTQADPAGSSDGAAAQP